MSVFKKRKRLGGTNTKQATPELNINVGYEDEDIESNELQPLRVNRLEFRDNDFTDSNDNKSNSDSEYDNLIENMKLANSNYNKDSGAKIKAITDDNDDDDSNAVEDITIDDINMPVTEVDSTNLEDTRLALTDKEKRVEELTRKNEIESGLARLDNRITDWEKKILSQNIGIQDQADIEMPELTISDLDDPIGEHISALSRSQKFLTLQLERLNNERNNLENDINMLIKSISTQQ